MQQHHPFLVWRPSSYSCCIKHSSSQSIRLPCTPNPIYLTHWCVKSVYAAGQTLSWLEMTLVLIMAFVLHKRRASGVASRAWGELAFGQSDPRLALFLLGIGADWIQDSPHQPFSMRLSSQTKQALGKEAATVSLLGMELLVFTPIHLVRDQVQFKLEIIPIDVHHQYSWAQKQKSFKWSVLVILLNLNFSNNSHGFSQTTGKTTPLGQKEQSLILWIKNVLAS